MSSPEYRRRKPTIQFSVLPPTLARALRRVIRRVRRIILLRGLLATFATGLLALLVAMAIDATTVILNVAWRYILSGGVLLATLFTATRRLFIPLSRPFTPVRIAALIERRHPELEERLSTVVELLSGEQSLIGSKSLFAAVLEDACADVESLDVERAFTLRTVKPRLVLACTALAALLTLFVASPRPAGRLFLRALAPFAQVDNFFAGMLSVSPGNANVIVGTPLEITAVTLPSLDRPPFIRFAQTGRIRTETVERMTLVETRTDGSRVYRHLVPAVSTSFQYRLTAGFAVTRHYRVEAVDRPEVRSIALQMAFPAYTKRADVLLTNSLHNLSAPAGTRLTWSAQYNRQPMQAALNFNGIRFDSEKVSGIDRWATTLVGDGERPWSIHLKDACGHTNHPVVHLLRVRPDAPPQVAIAEPQARRLELPRFTSLTLKCIMVDDFGIVAPAVQWALDDEPYVEKTPITSLTETSDPQTWTADVRLELSRFPIANARQIRFRVQASDNLPDFLDGPQCAFSEEVIVILNHLAKSIAAQVAKEQAEKIKDSLSEIERRLDAAGKSAEALGRPQQNETTDKELINALEKIQKDLLKAEELVQKTATEAKDSLHAPIARELKSTADRQLTEAARQASLAMLAEKEKIPEEIRALQEKLKEALDAFASLKDKNDDFGKDLQRLIELDELAMKEAALAKKADELEKKFKINTLIEEQSRLRQEMKRPIIHDPETLETMLANQQRELGAAKAQTARLAAQQEQLRKQTEALEDPTLREAAANAIARQTSKPDEQATPEELARARQEELARRIEELETKTRKLQQSLRDWGQPAERAARLTEDATRQIEKAKRKATEAKDKISGGNDAKPRLDPACEAEKAKLDVKSAHDAARDAKTLQQRETNAMTRADEARRRAAQAKEALQKSKQLQVPENAHKARKLVETAQKSAREARNAASDAREAATAMRRKADILRNAAEAKQAQVAALEAAREVADAAGNATNKIAAQKAAAAAKQAEEAARRAVARQQAAHRAKIERNEATQALHDVAQKSSLAIEALKKKRPDATEKSAQARDAAVKAAQETREAAQAANEHAAALEKSAQAQEAADAKDQSQLTRQAATEARRVAEAQKRTAEALNAAAKAQEELAETLEQRTSTDGKKTEAKETDALSSAHEAANEAARQVAKALQAADTDDEATAATLASEAQKAAKEAARLAGEAARTAREQSSDHCENTRLSRQAEVKAEEAEALAKEAVRQADEGAEAKLKCDEASRTLQDSTQAAKVADEAQKQNRPDAPEKSAQAREAAAKAAQEAREAAQAAAKEAAALERSAQAQEAAAQAQRELAQAQREALKAAKITNKPKAVQTSREAAATANDAAKLASQAAKEARRVAEAQKRTAEALNAAAKAQEELAKALNQTESTDEKKSEAKATDDVSGARAAAEETAKLVAKNAKLAHDNDVRQLAAIAHEAANEAKKAATEARITAEPSFQDEAARTAAREAMQKAEDADKAARHSQAVADQAHDAATKSEKSLALAQASADDIEAAEKAAHQNPEEAPENQARQQAMASEAAKQTAEALRQTQEASALAHEAAAQVEEEVLRSAKEERRAADAKASETDAQAQLQVARAADAAEALVKRARDNAISTEAARAKAKEAELRETKNAEMRLRNAQDAKDTRQPHAKIAQTQAQADEAQRAAEKARKDFKEADAAAKAAATQMKDDLALAQQVLEQLVEMQTAEAAKLEGETTKETDAVGELMRRSRRIEAEASKPLDLAVKASQPEIATSLPIQAEAQRALEEATRSLEKAAESMTPLFDKLAGQLNRKPDDPPPNLPSTAKTAQENAHQAQMRAESLLRDASRPEFSDAQQKQSLDQARQQLDRVIAEQTKAVESLDAPQYETPRIAQEDARAIEQAAHNALERALKDQAKLAQAKREAKKSADDAFGAMDLARNQAKIADDAARKAEIALKAAEAEVDNIQRQTAMRTAKEAAKQAENQAETAHDRARDLQAIADDARKLEAEASKALDTSLKNVRNRQHEACIAQIEAAAALETLPTADANATEAARPPTLKAEAAMDKAEAAWHELAAMNNLELAAEAATKAQRLATQSQTKAHDSDSLEALCAAQRETAERQNQAKSALTQMEQSLLDGQMPRKIAQGIQEAQKAQQQAHAMQESAAEALRGAQRSRQQAQSALQQAQNLARQAQTNPAMQEQANKAEAQAKQLEEAAQRAKQKARQTQAAAAQAQQEAARRSENAMAATRTMRASHKENLRKEADNAVETAAATLHNQAKMLANKLNIPLEQMPSANATPQRQEGDPAKPPANQSSHSSTPAPEASGNGDNSANDARTEDEKQKTENFEMDDVAQSRSGGLFPSWFRFRGFHSGEAETESWEETPPEYRSLVRDYFKKLSEEEDSRE